VQCNQTVEFCGLIASSSVHLCCCNKTVKSKLKDMAAKNKTRSELSEVLLLFTTKEDDPLTFSYEIECTTFKAVTITLNFEGSENFAVEGQKGLKLVASVKPFSRVFMGKIYLVSDDKRASLKMGCEWVMSDPSPEETAAYIQAHMRRMAPVLKEAQTIPFPADHADLDDVKVHQICNNYGKKFIDKDFLPTTTSLFKKSTKLLPGELSGSAVTKRSAIEWKRAAEFMEGEYAVFEGGIHPGDIRQGMVYV
jgi:hypothetical protein